MNEWKIKNKWTGETHTKAIRASRIKLKILSAIFFYARSFFPFSWKDTILLFQNLFTEKHARISSYIFHSCVPWSSHMNTPMNGTLKKLYRCLMLTSYSAKKKKKFLPNGKRMVVFDFDCFRQVHNRIITVDYGIDQYLWSLNENRPKHHTYKKTLAIIATRYHWTLNSGNDNDGKYIWSSLNWMTKCRRNYKTVGGDVVARAEAIHIFLGIMEWMISTHLQAKISHECVTK